MLQRYIQRWQNNFNKIVEREKKMLHRTGSSAVTKSPWKGKTKKERRKKKLIQSSLPVFVVGEPLSNRA